MADEIDLHVRLLCLHGGKGTRKSVFLSCTPLQTCVADLKVRLFKEQPAEEIELVHQGIVMETHSALVQYNLMAAPVIDAIITVTTHQETVALVEPKTFKPGMAGFARFKDTMFCNSSCPKAETFNPYECAGQTEKKRTKKAKLHYFKSCSKIGKAENQVCHSMSIHIFALVVCNESAVRTDFYLNMDPSASFVSIAEIKDSVRTVIEEYSAVVELMLVSDHLTPLDDDHSFERYAFSPELSAIISF